MDYQATFRIDHGVSPGFGIKYPDNTIKDEKFSAQDSQEAYKKAISLATDFADDYLSNPETGFTTVQIISLKDKNNEIPIDISKRTIKRSMLEHLLASNSK